MIEPIKSLEDLLAYSLRRLGAGAMKINITEDQKQDRLIDALQLFSKHHFDAYRESFVILDRSKGKFDGHGKVEFELDANVLSIQEILDAGPYITNDPQLNLNWEFWEDKIRSGNIDLIGYEMLQQKLGLLHYKLIRSIPINFNFSTHTVSLYSLPADYEKIVLRIYLINDDYENFPTLLNNEWLKEYLTALLRIQWGENLSKYINVPLPGGGTLNSMDILNRGLADKERLEKSLRDENELPIDFILG
jgi:hypothetical protein